MRCAAATAAGAHRLSTELALTPSHLDAPRPRPAPQASTLEQLCAAAYAGDAGGGARLLAALPDRAVLQASGSDGFTPLHKACIGGHAETVTALLAAGADPRQRDAVRGPPDTGACASVNRGRGRGRRAAAAAP